MLNILDMTRFSRYDVVFSLTISGFSKLPNYVRRTRRICRDTYAADMKRATTGHLPDSGGSRTLFLHRNRTAVCPLMSFSSYFSKRNLYDNFTYTERELQPDLARSHP